MESHVRVKPTEAPRAPTEPLSGLIPTEGGLQPVQVVPVRVLGQGRAAEARLVDVTTLDGRQLRCVEKVFCPGLLTRTIYRVCFQAPFAYQDNADAILASFYRRRLAWAMVRALVPDADVARPLYVRWDDSSAALVLASEFAIGRGIVPAAVDTHMIRRRLSQRILGESSSDPAPPEEIAELLKLMRRLERLFIDSGLVGTGWQVCPRAIVSTANLLRTEQGYVAIDLESGIPSVLVSTYLMAGWRLSSLPLFDDLDVGQFQRWAERSRPQLEQRLSAAEMRQFDSDQLRLVEHTQRWKASEPAVLRRPSRLWSPDFSAAYGQRVLDSWTRQRLIDQPTQQQLWKPTARLYRTRIYWLGWIPGRVGRCLQRYHGNQAYRLQVHRFFQDDDYCGQVVRQYLAQCIQRWLAKGRIGLEQANRMSPPRFACHWLLAKVTPAPIQRWLGDSEYRRNRLIRLVLLCSHGRFQSEFGRLMIGRRLDVWQRDGRLSTQQVDALKGQLGTPTIEEYVRGFGMHLGLKLLLPLVLPLKAVGAAAMLASGNPLYFLLMFMILPLLRTMVTLWRKLATGRPLSDFRDALLVGILPSVGSLAFPVQMYSRCADLSAFLMRDFAARIGRNLPIYGGKDSRTEMATIKAVNVVVELMEVWLALLRSRGGQNARWQPAEDRQHFQPSVRLSAWDRAALRQLELIAAELENDSNSDGESSTALQHSVETYRPTRVA